MRFLGTFLEQPADVPAQAVASMAGQLGIQAGGLLADYAGTSDTGTIRPRSETATAIAPSPNPSCSSGLTAGSTPCAGLPPLPARPGARRPPWCDTDLGFWVHGAVADRAPASPAARIRPLSGRAAVAFAQVV